MGLVQSVEGPHRTERQRNGNSLWLEVGSPASPVFGHPCCWFLGLWTQTRTYTMVPLLHFGAFGLGFMLLVLLILRPLNLD